MGINNRIRRLNADFVRFMVWKNKDSNTQMFSMIDVLKPYSLLGFMRFFVFFEKENFYDKTDLSTTQINKKIAAYHQYYAV